MRFANTVNEAVDSYLIAFGHSFEITASSRASCSSCFTRQIPLRRQKPISGKGNDKPNHFRPV